LIENWIDETERRTWLLAAISGEAEVPGQIVVSGKIDRKSSSVLQKD
jgi:hypothetical protein